MALAKAFPDAFMYELQEPSSVSYSFIIFREHSTPQYAACYCNLACDIETLLLFLRRQASVILDQPLYHRLQHCPATPPLTTVRPRIMMKTNAMTRTWRRRKIGWTSASPTLCHTKTSLLLSMPPVETATVTKTETHMYMHRVHAKHY